jgi:hypothetical protein
MRNTFLLILLRRFYVTSKSRYICIHSYFQKQQEHSVFFYNRAIHESLLLQFSSGKARQHHSSKWNTKQLNSWKFSCETSLLCLISQRVSLSQGVSNMRRNWKTTWTSKRITLFQKTKASGHNTMMTLSSIRFHATFLCKKHETL